MWNIEDRFSPTAIERLAALGFAVGSTRGVVRVEKYGAGAEFRQDPDGHGHRSGLRLPSGLVRPPSILRTGLKDFFNPPDKATLFCAHTDGEVIAVDIKRDLQIALIKVRPFGIVKAQDVAARQDDLAHGIRVSGSSFQKIA